MKNLIYSVSVVVLFAIALFLQIRPISSTEEPYHVSFWVPFAGFVFLCLSRLLAVIACKLPRAIAIGECVVFFLFSWALRESFNFS
jgi:hypothetical protein